MAFRNGSLVHRSQPDISVIVTLLNKVTNTCKAFQSKMRRNTVRVMHLAQKHNKHCYSIGTK